MWPAAIKRTYFFTKASDIFAQFNHIWIFSESYRKFSISKLIEIHPVGAAITHTERETDGHDEAYKAVLATVRMCLKIWDKLLHPLPETPHIYFQSASSTTAAVSENR
jgi:hypothetical protein